MRAFLKSVSYGAMVGAAPFLLLLAVMSFWIDRSAAMSDLAAVLLFLVLALGISFTIVLAVSLLIGLPLVWFLRRRQRESAHAYIGTATLVGALVPAFFLLDSLFEGGLWLICILGAAAGAMTGRTWWHATRGGSPASDDGVPRRSPPVGAR